MKRVRGGQFFLSVLLLAIFASSAFAGFSTVVIDAGHGGGDPGGIPGQCVQEKIVALDVAKRLDSYLQQGGLHTVMTRSNDAFIPLQRRVAFANAHRDAVFVSIHFNASPRAGAHGFETYYYHPSAAALAARIQSRITLIHADDNRNVKRRAYYVLRKTTIPAVLVECGFLTNPYEARLALNADYRETLARHIGRAILEQSSR